ncbi:MAG TPA: DUF2934 domain-containing protein [Opitutaceae bacterium]|nr:DUF2934 domain-containing protein [Opitutaceae bacterium]
MNANTPTQEEVARRAYEIWETEGNPGGRDVEFWLEAERQLTARHRHPHAEPVAGSHAPQHPPPPNPAELAALAHQQRTEARAPHLPHKPAPKAAPAESGKPLWDKPHSR